MVLRPQCAVRLSAFSWLRRIPLPAPGPRPMSVSYRRVHDCPVVRAAWGNPSSREASSSTSGWGAPTAKVAYRRRPISSLDPNALNARDFVDLSGMVEPALRCNLIQVTVGYKSYGKGYMNRVPFPPGTHGFLYFRRSPHQHAAAGEIRFRICRLEDARLPVAEAFALGSDLISFNGITPWRIPILNVFKHYPAIRDQLVAEGLVSTARASEIGTILASGLHLPTQARTILENITDPFIWDLRNHRPTLMILHQDRVFAGNPSIAPGRPYNLSRLMKLASGTRSGKALVRFEVSRVEASAEPKVVLRVLKILEPPKPEDAEIANQIFKEGELVHYYNVETGKRMGPWSLTRQAEDRFVTPNSRKILEDTYLAKQVAP